MHQPGSYLHQAQAPALRASVVHRHYRFRSPLHTRPALRSALALVQVVVAVVVVVTVAVGSGVGYAPAMSCCAIEAAPESVYSPDSTVVYRAVSLPACQTQTPNSVRGLARGDPSEPT